MIASARERWEEALRTLSHAAVPHAAQLWESPHFLAEAVSTFVAAGLARGERALLIAEPRHLDLIAGALRARDVDVDALIDAGRIAAVNAWAMREALVRGGAIDEASFEREVGALLAHTRDDAGLCIYGETVNLLWRDGHQALALELEARWDAMLGGARASLLCGYQLDAVGRSAAGFDDMCRVHGRMLPSDRFLSLDDADQQLARVAQLEQQARALRASETFARGVLEASRDRIEVLALDGRVVFANARAPRDARAVIGASWLAGWSGDVHEAAAAALDAARAGHSRELTARDGAAWWQVVVSPIIDHGVVTQLVAVSRDVTEHQRMELELRRSIEARDEFLAIASHELRTPLTSLVMQHDLMQLRLRRDGAIDPVNLQRLLDVSRRQLTRLNAQVDCMLDVTALRSGRLELQREPLALADVVGSVHERVRDQFKATGSPLTVDIGTELGGCWDRARLEQVIENLLGNALKYAPGAPVQIGASGDGARVQLTVADQGPGIAADRQAHIFDRFERAGAPRAITGLGLGLYIAREIVHAHGGQIALSSRLGQGAAFTIDLPRGVDPAIPAGDRMLA